MNFDISPGIFGAVLLVLFLIVVALVVYVVRKLPAGTPLADFKAVEADVANAATQLEADVKKKATLLPAIADKFRMAIWLVIGIVLYAASRYVGPADPLIQTTLYKLGHVTTLAWFGYWISRHALGRIDTGSTVQDRIARALVVGAVILAGALGL